ncbi:hypothetical protein FGG08_005822 [Glutinoglossum americanum]|uniref:CDP-diacylglycerol--glycerol-3-phosphate 3-phosphatidyltransferase n=1 Tax=Glutinoglossum americanum TaxID=1670608 RepID=A0A9P8L1H8_9PEZI|nr:hypothetical protein FGG08_005822 [Glutinoglossum americanum]
MLGGLTSELDRIAPRFDIHASQVRILQTPTEFYDTLKVSAIRQSLQTHPKLKVSFLTDALRGTRETPDPSCASLLVPLVVEFGSDRVEIRMYHTPNLTGLRKKLIPKRINEGWGLQHMKLYGIDDEIIISGCELLDGIGRANLSNDYFTNRQDRYHVFNSKEITDYFSDIHKGVSSLSYLVQPSTDGGVNSHISTGYHLEWPSSNPAPPPLTNPSAFAKSAGIVLNPLVKPLESSTKRTSAGPLDYDTIVYPLSQFTPLLHPDTSTEHPGLTTVLKALTAENWKASKWMFTAGYFNIHPKLKALLLASQSEHGTVVTASPWANGFYGSKGISGLLPSAYTLLSRRFLESVHRADRGSQIKLKEWRRGTVGKPGGWTYHAKGLWVTLPSELYPSVTLVGSSNYTKRSYSLDLEVNALVLTRNKELKRRLGEEQEWLLEHAKEVTLDDLRKTERRVGVGVRVAMGIVGLLGGAL